jgi:hypothetical protein
MGSVEMSLMDQQGGALFVGDPPTLDGKGRAAISTGQNALFL